MRTMCEPTRSPAPDRSAPRRAPAPAERGAETAAGGPLLARGIALQPAAGNRAAARVLSRWAAHPDKDKKGVLMTDEMVGQWNKFNPPLSK
jgi:hypothetical protein